MINRWFPASEQQLRDAVESGVLAEGHYVDFKSEIPSGPKANTALAIDVASLAVDGGLIVVGVSEKASDPLAPVPLTGLKERVDQVARSRIDAPLSVSASNSHRQPFRDPAI